MALLATVWAVVLVPSLLRPKLESSPIDAVRRFEYSMGILANARRRQSGPGRWVMVPRRSAAPDRRRQRVIRRRRQVFERLVMAAGATLILGIPSALRWLWWVHLLLDVAVVVYAVRLRRWKMQEQLRQRVVEIGPAEEGVPEVEEIPAARSFYTGA